MITKLGVEAPSPAPIGLPSVDAPPRLVDEASEAAARTAATATGYAELDADYAELQERLARAEVSAGACLPFDWHNDRDRELLAEISKLAEDVAQARDQFEQAQAALRQKEEALVSCAPPPALLKRALRACGIALVIILAAAASAALLTGGTDIYIFRNHLVGVFGFATGKETSVAVAASVSFAITFVLLLVPVVVLYNRHGSIPGWFKVAAIGCELGLGAAYAAIRAKDATLSESLASGLLELVILVIAACLPVALAPGFRAERAETLSWRTATRLRNTARAIAVEARLWFAAATAAHRAQVAVLEQRDLAARKIPAWMELAIASRLHGYVTATAAAQSEIARQGVAAHAQLLAAFDRHMVDNESRANARLENS